MPSGRGQGQQAAAGLAASRALRLDQTAQALENGRIPADIPPADNDSVIEAQIRQAAMNEPDPEIRRKLWNEYRRYKGLPSVE